MGDYDYSDGEFSDSSGGGNRHPRDRYGRERSRSPDAMDRWIAKEHAATGCRWTKQMTGIAGNIWYEREDAVGKIDGRWIYEDDPEAANLPQQYRRNHSFWDRDQSARNQRELVRYDDLDDDRRRDDRQRRDDRSTQ